LLSLFFDGFHAIVLLSSLFRYVWESKADGSFAISEDTWNEPLGRGTEIRLHLRDEAKEYLEEDKLKVFPY
jgi:HSP90 family molecular chaperone